MNQVLIKPNREIVLYIDEKIAFSGFIEELKHKHGEIYLKIIRKLLKDMILQIDWEIKQC